MDRSTRQLKDLASLFSRGKAMETSKVLTGTEGGTKRKNKSGDMYFQGSLSSSASILSGLTGLCVELVSPSAYQANLSGSNSSKSLPDSNIGFQLLKKSGWKEGSGLGVSEQGRVNPLEANLKLDRRGIGAEKKVKRKNDGLAKRQQDNVKKTKKEKNLAKKARKIKAEEEQMQKQAFERDFYREFWPENI